MKHKLAKITLVLFVLALTSLACEFSASTAKIASVQMARDAEGTQPTTEFAAEDTFYALADLQNAPDGTTVRAVWTAVAVEGTEPNLKIDEAELETGSGTVQFELSNNNLWPAGTYKVEIYLNGELAQTVEFSVR